MSNGSNQFSHEEQAVIAAGRDAINALAKTFDLWIVAGRAIRQIRERATQYGGRKTFQRMLNQQGFGPRVIAPAVVSKLLQIMERLAEVTAWHEGLTEKQRYEWSAPSTVFKHCPIFAKPKAERKPRLVEVERLDKVLEQRDARIEELEQELEAAKQTRSAADGFEGAYEQIGATVRAMGRKEQILAITRLMGEFKIDVVGSMVLDAPSRPARRRPVAGNDKPQPQP